MCLIILDFSIAYHFQSNKNNKRAKKSKGEPKEDSFDALAQKRVIKFYKM